MEVTDTACDIDVARDGQRNDGLRLLLVGCNEEPEKRGLTIQQNVNHGLLFWTCAAMLPQW